MPVKPHRQIANLTILLAIFGIAACGERGDEAQGNDPFGGGQSIDNSFQDEDPFGGSSRPSIHPSHPKPTTPPNFKRDFSRETTLSKLEEISFPSFETGADLPLCDVLAVIQAKSIELDFNESEPFEKGIHFEIWDWRRVKGTSDYNRELSPHRPLSMANDDELWMREGISIREMNINLGDLITKVTAMSKLDVYLSSQGIVLVPEGQDPNPTKREDVSIWQRFR